MLFKSVCHGLCACSVFRCSYGTFNGMARVVSFCGYSIVVVLCLCGFAGFVCSLVGCYGFPPFPSVVRCLDARVAPYVFCIMRRVVGVIVCCHRGPLFLLFDVAMHVVVLSSVPVICLYQSF